MEWYGLEIDYSFSKNSTPHLLTKLCFMVCLNRVYKPIQL